MDFNASEEIWRFFCRQQSTLSTIPTGILEETSLSAGSIIVSPNPSTGIFTLESATKILSVEITNALGVFVLSQQINSDKATIDLSNQANGIYFITVQTNEGAVKKKVVINY